MGEGGSSITGKIWNGVRTDVAYHVDTGTLPFERTWDWAKAKAIQVATFVVLTSAATIILDGGIRFTVNGGFSSNNKDRRGEILKDSFKKASGDYWSVAKPAGQAVGFLAVEGGKLAVTLVYEMGKAGYEVIFDGDKNAPEGKNSSSAQPNGHADISGANVSFASVRTTESKKSASYAAQQSSLPSFARDMGKEKMAFPKPGTTRAMHVAQVARSRIGQC